MDKKCGSFKFSGRELAFFKSVLSDISMKSESELERSCGKCLTGIIVPVLYSMGHSNFLASKLLFPSALITKGVQGKQLITAQLIS